MNLKNTAKVIYKHQGVIGLIRHFSPIIRHPLTGQILLMRGTWYHGHFMMSSFNRVKNREVKFIDDHNKSHFP
jgi:hypothetical protein